MLFCSRPFVFSPCFLAAQNHSLPLLAMTPWAGGQFWDARTGADTHDARLGAQFLFILSTTGARWGGGRQDGCLWAGGIADHSVKRGQRPKTLGKQQELRDSNWRLQILISTSYWICYSNILFFTCLDLLGKQWNLLYAFGRTLQPFFFFLLLHNPYAFPLRLALGVCKPHHPVPSTHAHAEDTEAVLMQ